MKIKNNNGIFYVAISLVVVLGIASGVVAFSGNNSGTVFEGDCVECTVEAPEVLNDNLGAFPGGDIYADINIRGALTYGGGMGYNTTTRDATHTLTYNDLNRYSYWDILNDEAADSDLTYTMPATATMMQILPEIGSTRKWLFHNATSGVNTLTLSAGTGMDLVSVTNNDDVIDQGEWAQLTCTQIVYRSDDNTNIMCIMDELLNAD